MVFSCLLGHVFYLFYFHFYQYSPSAKLSFGSHINKKNRISPIDGDRFPSYIEFLPKYISWKSFLLCCHIYSIRTEIIPQTDKTMNIRRSTRSSTLSLHSLALLRSFVWRVLSVSQHKTDHNLPSSTFPGVLLSSLDLKGLSTTLRPYHAAEYLYRVSQGLTHRASVSCH